VSGIKGGVGGLRKETAVLACLGSLDFQTVCQAHSGLVPSGRPFDRSSGRLFWPPPDGTSYSTWGVFPACTWCGCIPHPAVAAGKILLPAVVWEEGHEKACFWSHTAHLPDRYT